MNSQGRVRNQLLLLLDITLCICWEWLKKKFKGRFVNIAALQTEDLAVDLTVDWAQSTTMIDWTDLINSMDQCPFWKAIIFSLI
jgi:hypothetical protein